MIYPNSSKTLLIGMVLFLAIWGEQAYISGEKFLQFTLCGTQVPL